MITEHPKRPFPKRRRDKKPVYGRSGDLIIDSGAYDNITIVYKVATIPGLYGDRFIDEVLTELKAALCISSGYCKLFDTELLDGFYYAFCSGISDAVFTFDDMYEFSITFDCKPFFYLDSGQSVTVIPYSDISGTTLYNPGTVPSKPLIKLYGNGTLNGSIGGKSFTISNVSGNVVVDCDRMLVYKGAENKVDDFQGDYPEMPPGIVQVSFSGGGMVSAEITGRWCRL